MDDFTRHRALQLHPNPVLHETEWRNMWDRHRNMVRACSEVKPPPSCRVFNAGKMKKNRRPLSATTLQSHETKTAWAPFSHIPRVRQEAFSATCTKSAPTKPRPALRLASSPELPAATKTKPALRLASSPELPAATKTRPAAVLVAASSPEHPASISCSASQKCDAQVASHNLRGPDAAPRDAHSDGMSSADREALRMVRTHLMDAMKCLLESRTLDDDTERIRGKLFALLSDDALLKVMS
eukprot:GEMP01065614.1.p1 GENE.GEMP01065614.1~~GEMP01065614.1.p1  ORF type:complete len:241 (+),score=54.69 GEMP01065614.1:118-840(+)